MSSLPVTPPNLGELPIALTLPDELWIKILRELDYATLKKSSRICRKLQRFIGDKEFDQVLFRAGPSTPACEEGKAVQLHSIIKRTDGIFAQLEEAQMLDRPSGNVEYLPKDYPTILDEFATNPASTEINIEMEYGPVKYFAPLVDSTGITVRQFFNHLGEYWSTPASATAAEYAAKYYRRPRDPKNVCYIDVLGDHNGWTRRWGGTAQGGNRTHVVAGWIPRNFFKFASAELSL